MIRKSGYRLSERTMLKQKIERDAQAHRALATIRKHGMPMPDAIDLLKIRRSVKPREMVEPGPSPAELDTILTIGARVPDHGKLTPWRFIVFEGDARLRAGEVIAQVFARKNLAASEA